MQNYKSVLTPQSLLCLLTTARIETFSVGLIHAEWVCLLLGGVLKVKNTVYHILFFPLYCSSSESLSIRFTSTGISLILGGFDASRMFESLCQPQLSFYALRQSLKISKIKKVAVWLFLSSVLLESSCSYFSSFSCVSILHFMYWANQCTRASLILL